MTITSYATLVTAITDYMEDTNLAAKAPTFIQLAEATFNRRLHTFDQQGASTSTASAIVALPSDFNGVQSLNLDDYGPLAQLGHDDFQTVYAEDATTGVPVHYMLANGAFYLGPPPDSAYTVTLHYWKKLAALSTTNASNWLLETHPDLYLYASVMHAEMFGWNDDRLPLLKAAVDETMGEIMLATARAKTGDLVGAVPVDFF